VIERRVVTGREWRWVFSVSLVALAATCVPYLLGWSLETPDRVFGGCILLLEDSYSYLAKMRQGAEGAWLFHIAYTPEPHRGTLFFPFHLLLGKVAALLPGGTLAARMVWVYHGARVAFGLVLLVTVYRFLAACTERVPVRRLAWLMVTFGGGLGWLLVALGQPNWLGSTPLDFYLPEGFTFLVLYGFPHIALSRTLLLWGLLFLLKAWHEHPKSRAHTPNQVSRTTHHALRITHHASRITHRVSRFTHHVSRLTHHVLRITYHTSRRPALKWAVLSGFLWLAMALIVPFYVAVAWAVTGAAWLALGLRRRRVLFREGALAGVAALVPVPVVAYSAWAFTTDPVYATWAAQNQILSPHPFHYLAAYGIPLLLAAFAVQEAWGRERWGWLALAWVGAVPVLVYLPFNLQRRLIEGVQVPLSLLAAWGAMRLYRLGRRRLVTGLLAAMLPTTLVLLIGSSAWVCARPWPIFRDADEIATLDWLDGRSQPNDVILATHDTGAYLPVRVGGRAFLGHGLETVGAAEKERLVAHFFGATADDAWRRQLLTQYGIDYVFWGPQEQRLGPFDPYTAPYLRLAYEADGYAIFEVQP
jgi:hypothetical protein